MPPLAGGARRSSIGADTVEPDAEKWGQGCLSVRRRWRLPWLALKDTPEFGGAYIPGVYCEYFGCGDRGTWVYLVKHDAGVVGVART